MICSASVLQMLCAPSAIYRLYYTSSVMVFSYEINFIRQYHYKIALLTIFRNIQKTLSCCPFGFPIHTIFLTV